MSEPTPLSAHFQPLTLEEERRYFRWCDEQRDYIGRVTAWRKFDAQATEIAALKGALEELREYTVGRESVANVMGAGWQYFGPGELRTDLPSVPRPSNDESSLGR